MKTCILGKLNPRFPGGSRPTHCVIWYSTENQAVKKLHFNLNRANKIYMHYTVLGSVTIIYIYSRFSMNSEAVASEFIENLEEMFLWHW